LTIHTVTRLTRTNLARRKSWNFRHQFSMQNDG
jgi:hypothetical protein